MRADGVCVDVASLVPLSASVLAVYLSLLSSERLAEAEARENNRVYNTAVVVWLMIIQRLQVEGTLETAVLELPGLPASFWPNPCKRRQPGERRLSGNTGAYNQARQRLPVKVVQGLCDCLFEQLSAGTNGSLPTIGRRAFVFDGTTIRTPHTEKLKQLYPPTSNQEGESHWPLIRMVVAHDVVTGWGCARRGAR